MPKERVDVLAYKQGFLKRVNKQNVVLWQVWLSM